RLAPSLRLEPGMKRRAMNPLAETRDDSTADVDAAPRSEIERQVAGDAPEHGEEELDRLDTRLVRSCERACADVLGRELQRRTVRFGAGEAIEMDEAAARERTLGRGVAELAPKPGDQALFAFVLGAQRDVPAFRRDRHR